jgi:hypothetical protein
MTPPNEGESTGVQLARMEGKIDVTNAHVSGLLQRVDGHAGELTAVKSDIQGLKAKTQTLAESQIAEATKAIALAAALKEADEARRTKTETTWTPFNRALVVLGSLVGLATVWIQLSGK